MCDHEVLDGGLKILMDIWEKLGSSTFTVEDFVF